MMYEKRPAAVLIVDDDSGNRKQWKATFESASFRVLEASNRFDALTYLSDTGSEIDLLVTGVMRDGAGAQLAAEAFELRPTLPMIIVASAASQVGMHDHLAILLEPVSDTELVGTARALLAR
jgi:DNA-binding NtrC family response regulator